ncbi:hypothetical protein [Thalassospira lucentensis]
MLGPLIQDVILGVMLGVVLGAAKVGRYGAISRQSAGGPLGD